jgi:hypothetical protein
VAVAAAVRVLTAGELGLVAAETAVSKVRLAPLGRLIRAVAVAVREVMLTATVRLAARVLSFFVIPSITASPSVLV